MFYLCSNALESQSGLGLDRRVGLVGGGWAGPHPNEVPAILQHGKRVLSRADLAAAERSTDLRPTTGRYRWS